MFFMDYNSGIKFFIFLISAITIFFLFQEDLFAQRPAVESKIVSRAVEAVTPVAKNVYNRMKSRFSSSESIGRKVDEAKPFVQKAVPIIRKGFSIGKKILKILKKILR